MNILFKPLNMYFVFDYIWHISCEETEQNSTSFKIIAYKKKERKPESWPLPWQLLKAFNPPMSHLLTLSTVGGIRSTVVVLALWVISAFNDRCVRQVRYQNLPVVPAIRPRDFMVWQSLWFYSHRWAYVSCIGIRYGFYCHQTRVTFVFSLVFWLFPSSYLLFCDLLHLNSSADQKPFLCFVFFFCQMKCKTCIFFTI